MSNVQGDPRLESDAQPRLPAGLVNQSTPGNFDAVAAEYGRLVEAATQAPANVTADFTAVANHYLAPGVSTARPDMHENAR